MVSPSESALVLDGKLSWSRWLRELGQSRELFVFLAWRDILLRYKQAAFGIAWALLKPLLTSAIFTAVFSRILDLETGGTPYVLFALSGMVVWQFLAGCASDASMSLISNVSLVTKVYFPRLLVPASVIVVNLLDALVGLVFLVGAWAYLGSPSPGPLYWLPLLGLWTLLLALGAGAWLAALTVRYRDTKFLVPFGLQIGLYASPVAYPITALPEVLRPWAYLNPATGLIEALRFAYFDLAPAWPPGIWISAGVSLFILVGGLLFFRRLEGSFADVI